MTGHSTGTVELLSDAATPPTNAIQKAQAYTNHRPLAIGIIQPNHYYKVINFVDILIWSEWDIKY